MSLTAISVRATPLRVREANDERSGGIDSPLASGKAHLNRAFIRAPDANARFTDSAQRGSPKAPGELVLSGIASMYSYHLRAGVSAPARPFPASRNQSDLSVS